MSSLAEPPFCGVRPWSSLPSTSEHSFSVWARVGTIGALGLVAFGVVDAFGAPTGAQVAAEVNEVVSAATDGTPLIGLSISPSLSDDGSIVVFSNVADADADADAASNSLFVRTRNVGTADARTDTVFPNGDESSVLPVVGAVSGDGCTIAYSVAVQAQETPPVTPTTTTSTTTTSTTTTSTTTTSTTTTTVAPDDAADGDAAVEDEGAQPEGDDADLADADNDAAAEAAGTTTELRIVDRCVPEGTALQQSVLDSIDTASSLPAPALSIDGSSIAWPVGDEVRVYSAESTPAIPAFVSVRSDVVDDKIGARLDVSADGRSVVFESGEANVDFESVEIDAVRPGDPVLTNIYFARLPGPSDPAGTVPIVGLLAPSRLGSSGPSISADGALIVYASDLPGLFVDAPAEGPYLVVADLGPAIADPVAGVVTQRILTSGATDASLSADGTAVVYNAFESVRVRRSDTGVRFEESTEVIVNRALSAQFGESVGSAVSVPVISADGALAAFDHEAGVDLATDASFAISGHVWAVETATIFDPPVVPTTTIETTTTVAVSTLPVGTPPPSVRVTSPVNTTRTTTRNTTRTTTRTTTRPTAATTTAVASLPTFEPAAFEFAPTIVADGRRTAQVILNNSGTESITISSVDVQPADAGFVVDTTTCAGVLAGGRQCAVTVSFAPTVTGEGTANLVATLADGTALTSALRGIGAPQPVLSVLPGVATNGQVVTVFGAGFPVGAIVEFSWNRGQVVSNITIDDLGTFAQTLVVLPNTATGPIDVLVAGQTDLFGDVTVSVLVTDHGGRGSTAVLGGGFGL